MKTILPLILAVVVTCLLLGCGPGDSPTLQAPLDPTAISDPIVRRGELVYAQSCVGCHGPNGQGLPNLGKNLTTSDFVASKSDRALVEFIKIGRPVTDPLNTTGIAMPPMNENMGLSDDKLNDLIAYLRWIQE